MQDKMSITGSNNNLPPKKFIDYLHNLLEEIIVKGEDFSRFKKWLKKFCDEYGVDYNDIETEIIDFVELATEFAKTGNSLIEKMLHKVAFNLYLTPTQTNTLIKKSKPKKKQKQPSLSVSNFLEINNTVEDLTKETFLKKVFNYEESKDWIFEGKLPCLIDFWADWCQPCKTVAPILEELSMEYEGKINIYKVNTEEQPELAQAFGISSIPSLLFCPMEGQSQMAQGALPKETLIQAINDVLLIED